MSSFNINKIMEKYSLEADDTDCVSFPNVKYPEMAFDRILKGEANLDTDQIERLADFIGVMVSDLFLVDDWKGLSEDNCIVFIKGQYKIKLNYNEVYLSIYKNNTLLYKGLIIPVAKSELNFTVLTVEQFIDYINNFIKDYENGNN